MAVGAVALSPPIVHEWCVQLVFFAMLLVVGVSHTGRDAEYTFGFQQALEAALVGEELGGPYPDTFEDIGTQTCGAHVCLRGELSMPMRLWSRTANLEDYELWLRETVTSALYGDSLLCVGLVHVVAATAVALTLAALAASQVTSWWRRGCCLRA